MPVASTASVRHERFTNHTADGDSQQPATKMKPDKRIKELFAQALECKSPAEREKYLAEASQGEPEFRREIESLLRAAEQAGDFLHPTIKVTEGLKLFQISL